VVSVLEHPATPPATSHASTSELMVTVSSTVAMALTTGVTPRRMDANRKMGSVWSAGREEGDDEVVEAEREGEQEARHDRRPELGDGHLAEGAPG